MMVHTRLVIVTKETLTTTRSNNFSLLASIILIRERNVSLELAVTVVWETARYFQFFQKLLLPIYIVWCSRMSRITNVSSIQFMMSTTMQRRHLGKQWMSSILTS
jgi:hypothetical protein